MTRAPRLRVRRIVWRPRGTIPLFVVAHSEHTGQSDDPARGWNLAPSGAPPGVVTPTAPAARASDGTCTPWGVADCGWGSVRGTPAPSASDGDEPVEHRGERASEVRSTRPVVVRRTPPTPAPTSLSAARRGSAWRQHDPVGDLPATPGTPGRKATPWVPRRREWYTMERDRPVTPHKLWSRPSVAAGRATPDQDASVRAWRSSPASEPTAPVRVTRPRPVHSGERRPPRFEDVSLRDLELELSR